MKSGVIILFAFSILNSGCQAIYSVAKRNDTSLKYEKVVTANLDKTAKFSYIEVSGNTVVTKQGYNVSLKDEFLKAKQDAFLAGNNAAKNRDYFDKGVAYSNGITDAWFSAIFSEVRQHKYNLDFFNILMGAAIAGFGIAEANSTIVGSAGIAQSLVNAEAQSYSASFLFTPQVQALKTKLTSARNELKNAIASDTNNFLSFAAAQNALQQYDQTRTPGYIQELVRKSTDLVKFAVVDTDDYAKQAKIEATLVKLANALNVNSGLSVDDAKGIYIMVYAKDTKAAKAFAAQYRNLASKVAPQLTNPTGLFEDSLRELNALLDFAGYAKGIAEAEQADEESNQKNIAASASGTPTMSLAAPMRAIEADSKGNRVELEAYTVADVAAMNARSPGIGRRLADSQTRINELKQLAQNLAAFRARGTKRITPEIRVVPETASP